MNDADLHQFYLNFVARLRGKGVLCAITSGLACVHFGVAETTKDCDLLCHPGSFDVLLDELAKTPVNGLACRYRGNLSPPLDERWHRGGWTSHFNWGRGPGAVTFDVFGRALRASTPWQNELSGLYASPHIVAEMKRTSRDKDWPFITALGTRLIELGDERGWLHIFDEDILKELLRDYSCPPAIASLRPALMLANSADRRLKISLLAERLFWEQLDTLRIRIYERALRPYNTAVRKAVITDTASLSEEHEIRQRCALDHLAPSPLQDYGIGRLIEEAKHAAIAESGLVPEAALMLPDVTANFSFIS